MDLKQELKPSVRFGQQQIQRMNLLQMSTVDFSLYLQEQAVENPLIDLDWLTERLAPEQPDMLSRSARRIPAAEDDAVPELYEPGPAGWDISLEENLLLQLAACRLKAREDRIARWLIACVDEKGYLHEDPAQVAELFQVDVPRVEKLLGLLRGFSPPGICAADLKSCLLYQARSLPDHELVCAILQDHLDDAARGRWAHIAAELGASLQQVRDAMQSIRALAPIPAAGFPESAVTVYTRPDVQISAEEDGKLHVALCAPLGASLRMNRYYLHLYQESQDPDVLQYLGEKLKALQNLEQNIAHRESTMLRCAESIARQQHAFFLDKDAPLLPLGMHRIAQELNLNVSTVSRAVKNKYVLCSRGLYPMRYFFSRGVEGTEQGLSSLNQVQSRIDQLIRGENPAAPLSDQQLCSMLAGEGVPVSRRAVREYREKLGYPNSFARKQMEKR